jgi:outer membrane lipoprotein SlyB
MLKQGLSQGVLIAVAGAFCLSVAGCATTSAPPGPSLAVMPAKGKSYEQFQREDDYCQAQASRAVGGQSPGDQAQQSTVNGAVVGTALGALAGAAIGSTSGQVGTGAAIGAGTGLIAGTAIGAENGRAAGGNTQARYDTVYAQCMSAKGNQVNVAPPPRTTTYVYEEPAPVYVYPRPYYWGYGRRW